MASTLVNFPFKNQNTTVLQDGEIDPGGAFDCVSTSIAAGMQYLTGQAFEGGILKELIYGADYVGGQDAAAYVQYCAHFGVQLYPIDGSPAYLTTLAHQHIAAGSPVLLTEDDPYVNTSLPQFAGWTHVIVLYSEAPGLLVAMDPFIADSVSKSDGTWQQLMRDNEIWILEKVVQDVAISLTTPNVATYFRQSANGMWSCITPAHNFAIGGGILTFYRTLGNAGLCGLTHLGLPTSGEYSLHINGHPEIVAQNFERGKLVYDPSHIFDRPPGAGSVYFAHEEAPVTSGISQEQYNSVQSALIGTQNQLKTLQAKLQKAQEDLK